MSQSFASLIALLVATTVGLSGHLPAPGPVGSATGPEVAAVTPPRVVFLVRHANRDPGQDSLNDLGKERAQSLARALKDAGIGAIHTSKADRTVQTAEPLASQLGLTVKQDSMDDVAALIGKAQLEPAGQRVLIVGHSNTVPEAIARLGVVEPVVIKEEDFDLLFVVTIPADGTKANLIRLHYGPGSP